jgi:fumarate hydratase class I
MTPMLANEGFPRYYSLMHGFDHAACQSLLLAHDGELPVPFDRLALDPPRMEHALRQDFIIVPETSLEALAARAFSDIQFRLRPSFLAELAAVAYAPDSDRRDRYVARTLLENARISAAGTFPVCQDTGTAAVFGWKGDRVIVEGEPSGDTSTDDGDILERGARAAWKYKRLRNSQVAPLTAFGERNTGTNGPLAAHIFSVRGEQYRFLFVAKGGGSSNKTALFQETKRLLRPEAFSAFVATAIKSLGVSACPPYRIAVVLGGQSPEEAALAGKLASSGALDALPSAPDEKGGPYRDRSLEAVVMAAAAGSGWGAQFGGRFLARDARVIRLLRHAASLPVVVAVSCSAHRQAYAYIDRGGCFVERLAGIEEIDRIVESAEQRLRPLAVQPGFQATATHAVDTGGPLVDAEPRIGGAAAFSDARVVDLGEPGSEQFKKAIASLGAGELVALRGKAVLARDAAHARLLGMMERGEDLPDWSRYPAFYASPTETPDGQIVGSIGPTTSKRMDSYLEAFGERGVFPLTIGKGERAAVCAQTCERYGNAYLAAIGGAAALAASRYVSSCAVIDWPELGMEAVRLVEFSGLPVLVAVDSRGEDYYRGLVD